MFCASLADVFDNQVPPAWRLDLFALIECTPELDWLLLTKRPENIRKMVPLFWQGGLSNVWLGTTAEDQKHLEQRVPHLLKVPAVVRFLSCEPLINRITFRWAMWDNWRDADNQERAEVDHLDGLRMLDWIIVGGESGHGARMMQPAWAETVRDECAEARVPFFMKQMTGKRPIPADLMVREFPALRRPQ